MPSSRGSPSTGFSLERQAWGRGRMSGAPGSEHRSLPVTASQAACTQHGACLASGIPSLRQARMHRATHILPEACRWRSSAAPADRRCSPPSPPRSRLSKIMGIPHISAGDLVRDEIKRGSPLAKEARGAPEKETRTGEGAPANEWRCFAARTPSLACARLCDDACTTRSGRVRLSAPLCAPLRSRGSAAHSSGLIP